MNKIQKEVCEEAARIMALNPVFLDTETTGLKRHDEIISLALVDHDGSIIIDQRFCPSVAISGDAFDAHGITDEELNHEPLFHTVAEQLAEILRTRPVCIYNKLFDMKMILQTAGKQGYGELFDDVSAHSCVMKMYAKFYGDWNDKYETYKWQKLGNAAAQCGIQLDSSQLHGAVYDAQLTRLILMHMAKQVYVQNPASMKLVDTPVEYKI